MAASAAVSSSVAPSENIHIWNSSYDKSELEVIEIFFKIQDGLFEIIQISVYETSQ